MNSLETVMNHITQIRKEEKEKLILEKKLLANKNLLKAQLEEMLENCYQQLVALIGEGKGLSSEKGSKKYLIGYHTISLTFVGNDEPGSTFLTGVLSVDDDEHRKIMIYTNFNKETETFNWKTNAGLVSFDNFIELIRSLILL
ncbi:hypothetical protein [Lysinibacillus fusiformis]|uniref:hypothetical protein n=1 Tax=Lysinibacillus fusiformis TaxID=28031 RepID=UPI002E1BD772|nr:hypothetical protein [Lysinibacillus fusiformis]